MSSQYGERLPTNGWDWFTSLGHPSKFQRVSVLGFVTAPTSLNGGQPNLAPHNVWPSAGLLHYMYIFGGSCPITEFCQVQNSLCVQVLRSPIIGSIIARHLSSGHQPNFVTFSRRRHLYSAGRPSRWASAYILVLTCYINCYRRTYWSWRYAESIEGPSSTKHVPWTGHPDDVDDDQVVIGQWMITSVCT